MSGDPGISAFPDGDNLFKWIGTVVGPKGTVSHQNFCLPSNICAEKCDWKFKTSTVIYCCIPANNKDNLMNLMVLNNRISLFFPPPPPPPPLSLLPENS